jgi:hypothetical protein
MAAASIIEERIDKLHGELVSLLCGSPIKDAQYIKEATGGKIDPDNSENGQNLETAKAIVTVLSNIKGETIALKKRGSGRGRKRNTTSESSTSKTSKATTAKGRGRRRNPVEDDD